VRAEEVTCRLMMYSSCWRWRCKLLQQLLSAAGWVKQQMRPVGSEVLVVWVLNLVCPYIKVARG
jgi:hypothetical protein